MKISRVQKFSRGQQQTWATVRSTDRYTARRLGRGSAREGCGPLTNLRCSHRFVEVQVEVEVEVRSRAIRCLPLGSQWYLSPWTRGHRRTEDQTDRLASPQWYVSPWTGCTRSVADGKPRVAQSRLQGSPDNSWVSQASAPCRIEHAPEHSSATPYKQLRSLGSAESPTDSIWIRGIGVRCGVQPS